MRFKPVRDYVPPTGNLRVVSLEDPALHVCEVVSETEVRGMGTEGMSLYGETRDESLLQFDSTNPPTFYTLRSLDPEEIEGFIEHAPTLTERYRRALRCALIYVENVWLPDGTMRPTPWEPEREKMQGLEKGVVKMSEIRSLVRPRPTIFELGKLALDRADLHPKAESVCETLPGWQGRVAGRLRVAELRAAKAPPDSPPNE